MKLSIIIPVYNEEKTLKETLEQVLASSVPGIGQKEIIVVDDGSTDGSKEIAENFSNKNSEVRHLVHEKNSGKGGAVKTGLHAMTGDIVIIQDADLEYDPREYVKVLSPIISGRADIVYGSRFKGNGPHRVLYSIHALANKFLTLLSNFFTGLNLSDMETCYKAFSREAADSFKSKLRSKRFGIEPELTAYAARGKWRVYEVGISYYGRTYEEGKKIDWKDGLAAVWHIIYFNLLK
ncbi:glycosyl transferase [Candidatus Campbellbacteria bacterium CG11_big_fil_rev_8_21_14_0_20_44_21]|uniref:Glycosyl transferase n=1 Tax=Candidatus Campbellbacteria bacterium CG22_combo_CG10-13_8_21_14_all_43_18 TaxID=1974530 RepID=A0A2H0DW78_9BACT|nr:MAG: glycosyl transferase [Candidatus Campbellbacteria bacterium CG22_combo_CG10-13_8_21_14_all_43_18]PIR24011.1 MAG: glycosyl transferase [Candidatus Campbellbacteria bacterium CG11_big_fil_rev_8_21_14_0_20_44_21]